jgi:hypothetical protein
MPLRDLDAFIDATTGHDALALDDLVQKYPGLGRLLP